MAPRKRTSRTVPDAVSSSVKRLREVRGWTQGDLANRMTAHGYAWTRVTVAEVEGSRRRSVSVAELIGLAATFGVGIEGLLWPEGETAPLMLAADGDGRYEIPDRPGLLAAMVTAGTVGTFIDQVAEPKIRELVERTVSAYMDSVRKMADEIRNTAGWVEDEAEKGVDEILRAVRGY